MKYFLIQYDGDEEIIETNEVDIENYHSVLDKVHYYDTKYKHNRQVIKEWIESGEYKNDCLSISGDCEEEDGFYTGTMYLEIEIKE